MDVQFSNTVTTIVILSFFLFGISSGIVLPEFYWLCFLLFIVPIVLNILKSVHFKLILISIIVFVAGFSYSVYRTPGLKDHDISIYAPQKNVEIIGNVVDEPRTRSENNVKFIFSVEKIISNGRIVPVGGNILVTIFDKNRKFEVIKRGYKLKLRGSLNLPRSSTNPSSFDYKSYLQNKSVTAISFVKWNGYQILSTSESVMGKFLSYLGLVKEHIQFIHASALGVNESQVLGGIVLGERAIPMNKELREKFIKSGLVHILAASGINVALLALVWIFVTSRLSLPYSFQIAGGMIVVVIYSLLTGLPPSVLRASIMLEMILFGKLINKKADLASLILFVASLLLIYNPLMLKDIGFQLSFITAFGLIVSIPVFQKYIKVIPQSLAMLILVPFIAQVWALPVLLYHFHSFAVYSVFANFLSMPLVAIITYGGFVSSLITLIPVIGVYIATFIDYLLSPILSLLISIAGHFSNLPSSLEHFTINTMGGVLLCYLLIGILLFLMFKNYGKKVYLIYASTILLFFLVFNLVQYDKKQLKVVFFDVGDGDCIFIQTPGKKNILIDGGRRVSGDNNSAEWVLKPYFYSNNISEIDAIFLTHPQNDHIGGLPEIVNEFKVNNYFDAGLNSESSSYKELLMNVYKKNINYEVLRKNDRIDFLDGVDFKILFPDESVFMKSDLNNKSLVIKLNYNNISFLFTGDSESNVFNMIPESDLYCNILKVGHHGSKKSINEESLDKINPGLAVISGGRKGVHPSEKVLKLLDKYKIKTLSTFNNGAIELTSDGKTYDIKLFNEEGIGESKR